jgi:hypothetical protein
VWPAGRCGKSERFISVIPSLAVAESTARRILRSNDLTLVVTARPGDRESAFIDVGRRNYPFSCGGIGSAPFGRARQLPKSGQVESVSDGAAWGVRVAPFFCRETFLR